MNNTTTLPKRTLPPWLLVLLPLLLLALLVAGFLALDPLRFFQGAFHRWRS